MALKQPLDSPPHLYEMAANLKLERRLHPRVRFPSQPTPDFSGPTVFCDKRQFHIHDISEGGLCLDDPDDRFNGLIGKELILTVKVDEAFEIPVRVVGSNIQKRHIQFLEAPEPLKLGIRNWVQCGLRGQWLSALAFNENFPTCPILWSSLYDDSLFLSADARWRYTMGLEEEVIHIGEELWPIHDKSFDPISVRTFDRILICLENLNFKDEASEFLKRCLPVLRRRSFE